MLKGIPRKTVQSCGENSTRDILEIGSRASGYPGTGGLGSATLVGSCQLDSSGVNSIQLRYIYIFIFLPLSQGQVRWWLMDPNALFRVVRPCRSLFE